MLPEPQVLLPAPMRLVTLARSPVPRAPALLGEEPVLPQVRTSPQGRR